MTTTPNVPGGETPNGTPPQGETPITLQGTGETPGTAPTTSPDDLAKELDRLKTSLKRANAEAKENRELAEELKRIKAEAEAAKLSETEKLQKQVAALQAEKEQAVLAARALRISSAIQVQALQHNVDPALASKLISHADIEFDEATGNPKNIASLLSDLIKQYPILDPKLTGRQAAAGGGATNPSRSQSSAEHITREFVETMTAEQYARLTPAQRAEVQQVIAGGRSPFGQRSKH